MPGLRIRHPPTPFPVNPSWQYCERDAKLPALSVAPGVPPSAPNVPLSCPGGRPPSACTTPRLLGESLQNSRRRDLSASCPTPLTSEATAAGSFEVAPSATAHAATSASSFVRTTLCRPGSVPRIGTDLTGGRSYSPRASLRRR